MALFRPGDRIRVKDGDQHAGLIEALSYNSMYGNWEYYVRWDNFPKTSYAYIADDSDQLWEKLNSLNNSVDSDADMTGLYGTGMPAYVPPKLSNGKVDPMFCSHKWVDVGFHFTKIVCAHCDKEKS